MEKDTSGYGLKFIYPEIYAEPDQFGERGNYDDRDKYKTEFETVAVKEMDRKLKDLRKTITKSEQKWAETIPHRFQKVDEDALKQEQEKFLQKKRGIEDRIERSLKVQKVQQEKLERLEYTNRHFYKLTAPSPRTVAQQ